MSTLGFGLGGSLSALSISPVTSTHIAYDGVLLENTLVVDTSLGAVRSSDTASDTIGVSIGLEATKVFITTLSESIGMAPAVLSYYGMVVSEWVALGETLTPNGVYHLTGEEQLTLVETLLAGRPVTISETVGVSEILTAARTVAVLESLGLLEAFTPTTTYGVTVSQALSMTDVLARFIGADATDTVSIALTQVAAYYAVAGISEGVGVAETLAPQLLLRATLTEDVGLSAAQAVKMLFQPVLEEGVELSAGYLAPDGNVTTWVMNTRTGAVTEYDNYAFNSFARLGNKYIGATSAGVYELLGNSDAGTDIIAEMKGAFLQFGGTHLSRLKAAYIAASKSEDTFVLRIETLDGDIYDYSVDTRAGRSTKVHMGKGQRSRYFAYTLTSVGQDFDLDTLEFVPIVVQRRV